MSRISGALSVLKMLSYTGPRPNRYAGPISKAGGDISDAFASLAGAPIKHLPARYAELKRTLVPTKAHEAILVKSWSEVLLAVKELVADIKRRGPSVIPQIAYVDIQSGSISAAQLAQMRQVGSVIVKGAVSKEEALGWKAQIQEYTQMNRALARGFPAADPQVWEFYNTKAQTQARTHPAVLATQKFLLTQWNAAPDAQVLLTDPVVYFDRLRIRFPGDMHFALGPHIDGGSIERWEDPTYRKCFAALLTPAWRDHDAFDATHRIDANMDLYKGQGACNVFRPWQGWLSMSTTRAKEGTLQVFPNIPIASAYIILRPFFREIQPSSSFATFEEYLAVENWTLDLEGTAFPGSVPGRGQELSAETHPHLMLEETMTSMPLVEPGDQVYWHCDVIHAVESKHEGKGDSSVMYIPAVPLTVNNAEYLASERASFAAGLPPYDFSGGEGERDFKERGTVNDVHPDVVSRRAMGLEKFVANKDATPGQVEVVRQSNEWLFQA